MIRSPNRHAPCRLYMIRVHYPESVAFPAGLVLSGHGVEQDMVFSRRAKEGKGS